MKTVNMIPIAGIEFKWTIKNIRYLTKEGICYTEEFDSDCASCFAYHHNNVQVEFDQMPGKWFTSPAENIYKFEEFTFCKTPKCGLFTNDPNIIQITKLNEIANLLTEKNISYHAFSTLI
jgi:hypothetical protein